jgi:pheromone shutdown protein TraB
MEIVFCLALLIKLLHFQTTAKAIEFYNKKAKELEANITDLEKIVQGKSTNLKIIEDGMLFNLLFASFLVHMANLD